MWIHELHMHKTLQPIILTRIIVAQQHTKIFKEPSVYHTWGTAALTQSTWLHSLRTVYLQQKGGDTVCVIPIWFPPSKHISIYKHFQDNGIFFLKWTANPYIYSWLLQNGYNDGVISVCHHFCGKKGIRLVNKWDGSGEATSKCQSKGLFFLLIDTVREF